MTEFWKSLDTVQKDKVRMMVSRWTGCALGTVDKYGTGAINPSSKKKEIMRKKIKRYFNIDIDFAE